MIKHNPLNVIRGRKKMSKPCALKNLIGDSVIILMQKPLFFLKEKHSAHLDISLVIFILRT
jgi:hypothetical protein